MTTAMKMNPSAPIAPGENKLLDTLLEKLGLKNDAALSRALEVAPPVVSKIRHARLPIGAGLLIKMHDLTGMTINDMRVILGVPTK